MAGRECGTSNVPRLARREATKFEMVHGLPVITPNSDRKLTGFWAIPSQSARERVLQLHQECHQPRARIHARETKRRSAIDQGQACPPPYPVKPYSCRGYAEQTDQHLEKGRTRDT